MSFSIDRDYVVQTLVDLVRINSINSSLSPGGKDEAEIGAYVADALETIGMDVTVYEIEPGRVNTVGVLKGTGNGRSLLLNAHMDTVGVEGMTGDPFGAEIRDGRLYGRGAQDMKGSLVAMMGAAKALVDGGVTLAGDLLVTGVADEEYTSIGTDDLVKQVTADAAIVTEPSDLSLVRAHRGFIWYDVETFGRAAHGSRYNEGIDANMRMGRFLAKLDKLEQELRQRPAHPLAGPPSLHASRIQGGREISIYADHCLLQIERRIAPGETEAQATAELQAIIDQLAADDPTFKATVKPIFERAPFEIGTDARIVQALEQAMTKRLGHAPTHVGQTFWTDAAILAAAGIETVLVGPTGDGLHSAEEWVDIQSVVDLAAILAETAIAYCR
ncbi:MAG: ArgE/DapE family deacylase [Chloroflexi bacterium]|nr:ArgE/DapE family deacylase [Chloroflexota bacterium]